MRRWGALGGAVLLAILLLSGCWSAKELRDLPIVVGIGIDDNKDVIGEIIVTAQIVKAGALKDADRQSGGSAKKMLAQKPITIAFWNVKSSAPSVFKALREMTHVVDNRIYLAHNQAIIFGKDKAKKGIRQDLDFLIREPETRPVTDVFISASTAADILDVIPELGSIPVINLMKVAKAQQFNAQTYITHLQELIDMMLSETTAPVIPIVSVGMNDGQETLNIEGIAVFAGDKMVGELLPTEAMGFLWIKGQVKGGIIRVRFQNGYVNLEILSERTKVRPKVENGKITMQVDITVESILSEELGDFPIATGQMLTRLEELQAQRIKDEIAVSFHKASALDADIFGFGELMHKLYPDEWKSMKYDWIKHFKAIELDVKVDCAIRDTGMIGNPVVPMRE